MRLSSLGYLIKEGFRSIKQNRFMAIASVLVLISCLLLSGAAYLCFVNVEGAFEYLDDQNVATVWAVETADDATVDNLGNQLLAMSNVQSIELITKEQTLVEWASKLPDATYDAMQGDNNPFLDCYVVTFKDLSLLEQTINEIRTLPDVDDIGSSIDTAELLVSIRNTVMTIGGWIILLLLLVSLFIISNTIKLTVYSRRLEIGIMKSVGATKAFIRMPFVVEGMVLGIAAGVLSYGIIYFIYIRLVEAIHLGTMQLSKIESIGLSTMLPVWAELLIGFLVIGMLTGMIGSAISMGRYLKEESGVSGD